MAPGAVSKRRIRSPSPKRVTSSSFKRPRTGLTNHHDGSTKTPSYVPLPLSTTTRTRLDPPIAVEPPEPSWIGAEKFQCKYLARIGPNDPIFREGLAALVDLRASVDIATCVTNPIAFAANLMAAIYQEDGGIPTNYAKAMIEEEAGFKIARLLLPLLDHPVRAQAIARYVANMAPENSHFQSALQACFFDKSRDCDKVQSALSIPRGARFPLKTQAHFSDNTGTIECIQPIIKQEPDVEKPTSMGAQDAISFGRSSNDTAPLVDTRDHVTQEHERREPRFSYGRAMPSSLVWNRTDIQSDSRVATSNPRDSTNQYSQRIQKKPALAPGIEQSVQGNVAGSDSVPSSLAAHSTLPDSDGQPSQTIPNQVHIAAEENGQATPPIESSGSQSLSSPLAPTPNQISLKAPVIMKLNGQNHRAAPAVALRMENVSPKATDSHTVMLSEVDPPQQAVPHSLDEKALNAMSGHISSVPPASREIQKVIHALVAPEQLTSLENDERIAAEVKQRAKNHSTPAKDLGHAAETSATTTNSARRKSINSSSDSDDGSNLDPDSDGLDPASVEAHTKATSTAERRHPITKVQSKNGSSPVSESSFDSDTEYDSDDSASDDSEMLGQANAKTPIDEAQQLNRRVSKTPTLDLLIGEGSDFTRAQYNSLREQIMTQLHTRVYSMEGFKLAKKIGRGYGSKKFYSVDLTSMRSTIFSITNREGKTKRETVEIALQRFVMANRALFPELDQCRFLRELGKIIKD